MKKCAKFCKSELEHAKFSLKKKFLAFSLVELMLSLIVISLVAVAFSPVVTKKLKNQEINSSLAPNELPVGTIVAYLGQKAPDGWLMCDGKEFSEAKYPKLKLFLGKNKTPNLRGYIPKGATEEENK